MTILVPSFSYGSSSFLQVTRATIKAWMGLNFGMIPSLTSELAALERLKINEKCFDHSSAFILDWIVFILAGNKDSHYLGWVRNLEGSDQGLMSYLP